MREDLEFVRRTVEDVHPAVVEGLSGEQEECFDRALGATSEAMRAKDFWFVLDTFVASLGDAHTRAEFPYSGGSIPVSLQWLSEDGLVVTADSGELRRGDRVTAIGGATVDELFAICSTLIPAENVYWIRSLGADLIRTRAFHERYGLIDEERDVVDLSVRSPFGDERVVSFASVSEPSRSTTRRWLGRELVDSHTMLFWLDACSNTEEYRVFLSEMFAEIRAKHVDRLIVDVRRNGGGDSKVIDEFIHYLNVESYTTYGGTVRYSSQARAQRGYGRRRGSREFPQERRVNNPDPTLVFDGAVYVLTSTATFSSGSWFATILGDNDLATIVGEPTGNAPSSYGDILRFQAPNSKLLFTVSHKYWQRPDPGRDPSDALYPDLSIARRSADFVGDGDAQLLRVLESLGK